MQQVKTSTLKSSFTLNKLNNQSIPFQNGIPYPSFEPQERFIQSLSGPWKKQRFEADHNWTMMNRDIDWIEKTEKEAKSIIKHEFDDSHWETHSIPLPENKLTGEEEVNGAETYEDGVWYRKKFVLDQKWEKKVVTLKCLGLSYIGDFWINGEYIGYHEGGYTPFAFDVTPFIKSGDNLIAIRIDNPPWTSRDDIVPAVNNDFFNYTGIIQDIFLERTDSVQIARVDIVPINNSGDINISMVLENRTNTAKAVTIASAIHNTDFTNENWLVHPNAKSICQQQMDVKGLKDQSISLAAQESQVLTYKVKIQNPMFWSIREPHLYVFKALLYDNNKVIDSFYTQFGLRSVTTNQSTICLNEEPIFLAGVARHEEWPSYGRTASWDRIKSDFLKIHELSVNMVRTAHYPNHIYTFIMLDRLGLTSMSEIPLWQFETHHYQIQEERKITYQMWREMVFSNFNRPSIIMWSTQNESTDVTLRKKYNENLVRELRNSYNDQRLITQSAAADQPGYYDESMEPLDVAGWTMYFGIFHGSTPYEGTRDFIEQAHQQWPDKPIINTEYGIWSNADKSFLEKQVKIYEDVQAALIEKATVTPEGFINKNGFISGIDYWTAFDWYVNHNQFYQTMGMYHMDRETKKPLYYEFVKDHKRFMEQTNGIGKYESDQFEIPLTTQTQNLSPGNTEILFENEIDLTKYNYLVIKVYDPITTDGFTVEFINGKNESASYHTYDLLYDKTSDVFIPLWKLNESVIADIHSVQLRYDQERQLEILDITSAMGGK
ncbi:glycoside hydrolase family 2 protein [Gracilibacillus phocaeensis]|uniref:glycoside hydrolase family 2 protein n=1 Tax=Gracilibacillus phocaeensis TaxID=2042304 RepID=UPI0025706146|nr:glycoside hydrolase family 2 TIM barrel-domain containing protein [Gracilibacillus phocaeensis]